MMLYHMQTKLGKIGATFFLFVRMVKTHLLWHCIPFVNVQMIALPTSKALLDYRLFHDGISRWHRTLCCSYL